MTADELPDLEVSSLGPLEIDLEPSDGLDAVESEGTATLEGQQRRWLPAVFLGLLVVALFVGQATLFDTEPEPADVEEPSPSTFPTPTTPPTTPAPPTTVDPSVPLLGPAVNDIPPAQRHLVVPLFPGSEGTFVLLRRGTRVLMIDAQTGDGRIAELANANEPTVGATIGIANGRLLAIDGETIRALALNDQADLEVSGRALAIDTSHGATVITQSRQVSGEDGIRIRRTLLPAFYPSVWGINPPQDATLIGASTRVLLQDDDELFDPRNGRRAELGPGRIVGVGTDHVLVESCEPDGSCTTERVGDDGSVDDLGFVLPTFENDVQLVSPDGQWAVLGSAGGYQLQSLTDPTIRHTAGSFGTSFEAMSNPVPMAFTPDSRFVVAVVGGQLTITALHEPGWATREIPISSPDTPYAELVIAERPKR